MRSISVAVVLALAALVSAKPNGSPSCSVDGAGERIANGMGANKNKIACTFSSDKTTYTPGSNMAISWKCDGIDNFQGILAYASPQNEPAKRVGEFQLLDGLKSNKAICGDAAEKDNSVVTHDKPGTFAPTGSITYTASATDHGNLEFSFIILKKVADGFSWGVFPKAIVVSAPGSAAEGTNNYGTVAGADEYNCNCPAASTVSLIRKCMPKTTATTKVVVTKTKTTTCTSTTTTTEKVTSTVTETVGATCGAVAGGEETPSSSMMEHEMPTTTSAYGSGYGGYSSYSEDEDEE